MDCVIVAAWSSNGDCAQQVCTLDFLLVLKYVYNTFMRSKAVVQSSSSFHST